jgi:hypothetical protein
VIDIVSASSRIPLPLLADAFRRLGGSPLPQYRNSLNAAMSGSIPARRDNGRWSFAPDDLPLIAEVLGVTLPSQPQVLPGTPPRQLPGGTPAPKRRTPDLPPAAA